jgi:LAO/AO transport system kinase
VMELVEKALAGNSQALARLISMIEREAPEEPEIMAAIFSHTGRAHTIGITGPPGAGKSSLVDKLTALMRKDGLTVGIIAVDPTSPFTGGAVLGDRIRMQQHYLDDGVFIRSMATRGTRGGLPKTAPNVMKLLDASGKDIVLVETVGVGQTELDIMETVDTIVVALVPEAGDTIQTMKAGLMEIAEIFVVNKADRPGADRILTELKSMVQLGERRDAGWKIPVLLCQANRDEGTDAVYETLAQHRAYLASKGPSKEERREHRRKELLDILTHRFLKNVEELEQQDERFCALLAMADEEKANPYQIVRDIFQDEGLVRRILERDGGR